MFSSPKNLRLMNVGIQMFEILRYTQDDIVFLTINHLVMLSQTKHEFMNSVCSPFPSVSLRAS